MKQKISSLFLYHRDLIKQVILLLTLKKALIFYEMHIFRYKFSTILIFNIISILKLAYLAILMI